MNECLEFAKDAVLTFGQKTGCSFPSVGGVKVIESSGYESLFLPLVLRHKVESFPEIILERKALVDQVGRALRMSESAVSPFPFARLELLDKLLVHAL